MDKKKHARPGPKPVAYTEEVADLFIRNFPVSLRNKAKSKAAALGMPLREFAIQALTEKVHAKSA